MSFRPRLATQLKDALDTQKHPKFESYALVKEIKDALKKELPADDPARAPRSSRSTTSCCASRSSATRF